jgi:hypothetical protein
VRQMRLLAALAGSAAIMAAGALMLASPASASAGHPAVNNPRANAPTSIVLNALETDQGENLITFGDDERDMSVVAHLTANGHSLLGTADIRAQVDGQSVDVCQITSWDQNSHFGDCSPPANDTVHPGTYTVTAFFQGTGVLAPSVSNSLTLNVTNEGANVSDIQDSSLSMTFGNETADKFSFTVTPQFPGDTPTGEVKLFFADSGQGLCTATLSNGSGSCSASDDTGLGAGSYTIQAEYMGNGDFRAGLSRQATLTVNREASKTSLVVPSDVKSGNSDLLTAVVTPTRHGTPGGVVDFAVDGQTICHQMAIGDNQSAVCPSGRLSVGSHTVTAHYEGDHNFSASDSSQTFTVTKPKVHTTTVLHRSLASVRFGHEQKEHITVQVTARSGKVPGGTVTVKRGTVKVCSFTLKNGKGGCFLKAKQLGKGTYHLVASYPGNATFAKSASGQVKLVVTR